MFLHHLFNAVTLKERKICGISGRHCISVFDCSDGVRNTFISGNLNAFPVNGQHPCHGNNFCFSTKSWLCDNDIFKKKTGAQKYIIQHFDIIWHVNSIVLIHSLVSSTVAVKGNITSERMFVIRLCWYGERKTNNKNNA